MFNYAIVWDLNGVLFKHYSLDTETFAIVEQFNSLGIDQYICTNTLAWRLKEYKEKYDLDRYFKKIYSTQHLGFIKSDPNIFKILKHEIKKEVVLIDDQTRNLEVASSVGIKGILYTSDEELLNQLKLLGLNYDR